MKKLDILGTRIDNVNMNEAVDVCHKSIVEDKKITIFTPNTEFVMMAKRDDEFRAFLNKSDLNIPDGIGVIYASKIKKNPLKEKVGGYDLTVNLLKLANENNYKFYFVGGKPGVALKASENIAKNYPNVEVVGAKDGYFKGTHLDMEGHEEEMQIIADINAKKPNVLCIGFGAKKQEKWIIKNRHKLNVNIIIGNGGSVDVLAGNVKRAPDIFIKLGLEWFYRLITDPKRIKRQLLLPQFMLKIIFSNKDAVKIIE